MDGFFGSNDDQPMMMFQDDVMMFRDRFIIKNIYDKSSYYVFDLDLITIS